MVKFKVIALSVLTASVAAFATPAIAQYNYGDIECRDQGHIHVVSMTNRVICVDLSSDGSGDFTAYLDIFENGPDLGPTTTIAILGQRESTTVAITAAEGNPYLPGGGVVLFQPLDNTQSFLPRYIGDTQLIDLYFADYVEAVRLLADWSGRRAGQ